MIKNSLSSKHLSLFSGKKSSSRLLLVHISNFSTFSHHSGGTATSYPSRRHEEESRNVRVSVWWDFENCNLPVGANVFRVAQSITAAVRANGIKGPVQITAFGDVAQMSRQNQEALSSTGIYLNHIPRGGKNSADRSLLVDLMYWVSHNPPPAHLFLISGDRDFASTLHRLRMNNYNILLASTDNAPGVLCSAASIMWQWSSLVKGENLSGKHFNQPPDGPYGSWYGHYKAPLEDPFAVLEQPTCPPRVPGTDQPVCLRPSAEPSKCSQSDNLTDSENNVQSIPLVVVKEIRNILSQYPKGVSITELRAELSKSCLTIDKEFYGHKKFSKFLLAMPQVLKLQSRNDGQFFVRGVTPKVPDQVDLITGSSVSKGPVNNDGADSTVTAKLNDRRSQLDAKSLTPSGKQLDNSGNSQDNSITIQKPMGVCANPKVKNVSTNTQLSKAESVDDGSLRQAEPPVQDVDDATGTATQLHNLDQSPVNKVGFFKNIWRNWFGREDCGSKKIFSNSRDINSVELKSEGKDVTSTAQSLKSVGMDSSSSNSDEAILVHDNGTSRISQPSDEEMKTQGSNSFGQFLRTLLWGSSANTDDAGKLDGEKNLVEFASTKNEKFGEKSFWDELNSFLRTPEAAAIVKHSKTRMQMGHDLQKQGLPILSSLSEVDLLHLMELIILDKKWIQESLSKSYPFKLVYTDEKGSSSRPCNGLSSIFSNTLPTSGSERSGGFDQQNRCSTNADVSEPVRARVSSCKSRNEILADCERLLVEIVRKHPEGFNMGSFRRVFSERYSYTLDIQKLGYQKLATLLQIMPGVRIESTYILPAGGNLDKSTCANPKGQSVQETDNNKMKVHSRSCLSDTFGKEEDPWEELGPVDNSSSKKNGENGLAKSRNFKDDTNQKLDPGYESLSDDCLTDSEENSESTQDSSLLQILDSWYSTKDDNMKKGASENPGIEVDSSANNGSGVSSSTRSSTSSELSMMNGSCAPLGTSDKIGMMMNGSRKARTLKRSYSFVQDKGIENNDKLIDGILGSLKKSGEKSGETII